MFHAIGTEAVCTAQPETGLRGRLAPWAPYLLALFFAGWGLRSLSLPNLPSDAPNHLMNGAFLLDFVRSGNLLHPIEFAKDYYGRLPAITLPYHPPLFPAIEALCFWMFGMSVVTARLLIALSVAGSVLLFYRLATINGASRVVALCAVAAFFSMRYPAYLATNVMLEFPTLVFTLAALDQLRKMDEGYPLRAGLAYALLASAALWTKQQAVFLGLTPFFYIAITRQWRLLAGKTIWISSALLGAAAFGFTLLTAPFAGAGTLREVPAQSYIAATFWPRFVRYGEELLKAFGPAAGAWILGSFFVLCILSLLGKRKRETSLDLHLAWAPAAFAVLFLTGHFDKRYLFFVYPPLVLIGFAALTRLAEKVLRQWSWSAPAAIAVFCLLTIPWNPPLFHMTGPAEAAAGLVTGRPRRILYCGSLMNGNFIFAVRSLDPDLKTVVLRADKFGRQLTPEQIEEIAHRYGVEMIVHPQAGASQPCDSLRQKLPATFALERTVPMVSSAGNWNGSISTYRFLNPSPKPETTIRIAVPKIGGEIEAQFDQP